ncbi:hypothetical protein, partial [Citrobacter freundii]|uniref:hypothetical protein n=1 Tax=Citrobacter freundii TaxID=546 RepID=UPI00374F5A9C
GKNSLNRLIRCVCGKKIGPDPRNFNQRVSLGRNDLLIRTFPNRKVSLRLFSWGEVGEQIKREKNINFFINRFFGGMVFKPLI